METTVWGVGFPESGEFDVVGFGLNAVDHLCFVSGFPRPDTKPRVDGFVRSPGGQAASAMVVCARMGLRAKYVGKVGGDETGAFSLESIRSDGVDVEDVVEVPGVTNQLAMVIVDGSSGERTILWHRPAEIATLPDEITAEKVARGRALLIDGHDAPAAARAAALAKDRGIPVMLDAESVKDGTAEVVANTDILIASRDFPRAFTGASDIEQAFDLLRRAGPRVVGATLGSLGAVVMVADGSVVAAPAYRVNVVDTTGAGDVFHGAFLYGMLAGWSVNRTLAFANAAAALNCAAPGARGGVRSAADVAALVERGPGW
jgi:sugar/nucleoside kinase (ribokinase family)